MSLITFLYCSLEARGQSCPSSGDHMRGQLMLKVSRPQKRLQQDAGVVGVTSPLWAQLPTSAWEAFCVIRSPSSSLSPSFLSLLFLPSPLSSSSCFSSSPSFSLPLHLSLFVLFHLPILPQPPLSSFCVLETLTITVEPGLHYNFTTSWFSLPCAGITLPAFKFLLCTSRLLWSLAAPPSWAGLWSNYKE